MIAVNPIDQAESEDDEPICHVSPDGLLALIVVSDAEGETLIGFHGFDWHVTASALSHLSGLSELAACAKFVEDVLQNRATIAVLESHGEVLDIWVTDSPQTDLQVLKEGESLSFRYWSK